MVFILEEVKETVLDFSQGTVRIFWFNFDLMQYNSVKVKVSNF